MKDFNIGIKSGLMWLARPFVYFFTFLVLCAVAALATTVIGMLFGYILLIAWVTFYEWFHNTHNEMRMRPEKETLLATFVYAFSGGAQTSRSRYHY